MELKPLPDVAGQKSFQSRSTQKTFEGLKFVGMSHIQMPVQVNSQILSSQVSAFVNLMPGTSRGIHMSRLYNLLSQKLSSEKLSWTLMQKIAEEFVSSQEGISSHARLHIHLQWPMSRQALKSDLKGWRLYPVEMEVISTPQGPQFKLAVEVLYSSTCPASTALSRELWKESFQENFQSQSLSADSVMSWMDSFNGMPATPHAQRSRARVMVSFVPPADFGPEELVNGLETVLATPVQTAVKRVDEQEFARLNGENTMFCEDAARRVQNWLDSLSFIQSYQGYFEHQESLHAHNAVAEIEKNHPA